MKDIVLFFFLMFILFNVKSYLDIILQRLCLEWIWRRCQKRIWRIAKENTHDWTDIAFGYCFNMALTTLRQHKASKKEHALYGKFTCINLLIHVAVLGSCNFHCTARTLSMLVLINFNQSLPDLWHGQLEIICDGVRLFLPGFWIHCSIIFYV